MKFFSILLMLVGLILCPAYLIYSMSFSGTEVASLKFIDQDIETFSIGGFSSRSTGQDRSKKSHRLSLEPSMNPIRLVAKAVYIPRRSAPISASSRFELSVYNGNTLIEKGAFRISQSSDDSDSSNNSRVHTSQSIKVINVSQSHDYEMRLKRLSEQDVSVSELSVEVRRNVTLVDTKIWGTGLGLILVSIIGFFLSRNKSAKSTH